MQYVIIGKSVAGISAAASIRENHPGSKITIISGEKGDAYFRPMLPSILAGRKSVPDALFGDDVLRTDAITILLGTAIAIDTRKKIVILASGEHVPFDGLLIATGSSALKPAIQGIDGAGVFPLRNMAQALKIRDAASFSNSVAVIGGGLVGVKAALALAEPLSPGKPMREVTVIEARPRILTKLLDRRGEKLVRTAVHQEGVRVVTGASATAIIRKNGTVTGVKLSTGRTIKADLVIVATGSKPNCSFLRNSGIRTGQGIVVDELLRTNVAGIFAAGDVVEGSDPSTGARVVSGLWGNAREMGRIAGANMTGKRISYSGFLPLMNATEIAGIPFISVGIIEAESGRFETITREDANGYWKLVHDQERLVGAVFVGDLTRAGIYSSLSKNRLPMSWDRNHEARAHTMVRPHSKTRVNQVEKSTGSQGGLV